MPVLNRYRSALARRWPLRAQRKASTLRDTRLGPRSGWLLGFTGRQRNLLMRADRFTADPARHEHSRSTVLPMA